MWLVQTQFLWPWVIWLHWKNLVSGKASSSVKVFALLSVWQAAVLFLILFVLCESEEDDCDKTLWKLIFKVLTAQLLNHMVIHLYVRTLLSVCCLCRFSILRQRQTALLQRLRCSALMLRHQPTRHSRQCAKEGINLIYIINCYKVKIVNINHINIYPPSKGPRTTWMLDTVGSSLYNSYVCFPEVYLRSFPVTVLWHLFLFSSQWKAEIQDFCPSTRILLIGCKTDLRTDVCTRMELSNQKQSPVSHEQVCPMTSVSSSLRLI